VEKIAQWKEHNACHSPLKKIRELKLRSLRLSENAESVGETRSAEGEGRLGRLE
jgi:hypothetical protein